MNDQDRRRAYARALIERATGPIPRYGSPQWHDLPDTDPRRVAAVVIAAEAWATGADYLEEQVAHDAYAHWLTAKHNEDTQWLADVDAHRQQWKHLTKMNLPGAYADQPAPRPLGEALRECINQARAAHLRQQEVA